MPREPFFGPNAKPFAIQLAVALFMLLIIGPLAKPYLKPYSDKGVEWGFNQLCSIGLCTPEAEARIHGSERQ